MRSSVIVGAVLLAGLAVEATAGCPITTPPSRLNRGALMLALGNHSITAVGTEEWKEEHCGMTGGSLYKVGDGTPVDPRAKKGTWAIGGAGLNAVVSYTYTEGTKTSGPFTFRVYRDSGNLFFCTDTDPPQEVARITATGGLTGSCQ